MAVNKVVYGTETLIDLTEDTVTEDKVAEGYTVHLANGTRTVGTAVFSPVTSVNEQTGDVVLSASDVGALASDTHIPPDMVILSYGNSTWADFIAAYNTKTVVYCRASSNSNPASGSQTRLAFMAYVNNGDSPTNVEFQYYRSVATHTATQQGDQVFVYKLDKTSGWSVITREASIKVSAGTGLSQTFSNGTLTLSASGGSSINATTVTISPSDWSNGSCIKSVTGVTTSNNVLVTYAPASKLICATAGVYCSAQGAGTLTFSCESTPTNSITINVMIIS